MTDCYFENFSVDLTKDSLKFTYFGFTEGEVPSVKKQNKGFTVSCEEGMDEDEFRVKALKIVQEAIQALSVNRFDEFLIKGHIKS